MTTFDKREESFETQFVHDEDLKFKATARRDRLFGLWAAEKIGLTGLTAEDYAKKLVASDVETHDVFDKVRADFAVTAVKQSEEQIRRIMAELMARAVREIKAGR